MDLFDTYGTITSFGLLLFFIGGVLAILQGWGLILVADHRYLDRTSDPRRQVRATGRRVAE